MNLISFMTANFVARELNYDMPEGWNQGDAATNAWFAPLNTFEERFSKMLDEIVELGFDAIDLWTAHLNWEWATPAHLETAKRVLAERKLKVASYAGGFGDTAREFEAACLVCEHLDIPILGGGTGLIATDRAATVDILRRYGRVFAMENHPEASAVEILGKIGTGDDDVLGIAVDTGWFATQGADVLRELEVLLPRIRHVHLKDILKKNQLTTGYPFKDMGHETCRLGNGIVPIEETIRLLLEYGYRGALSVEHEPETHDPRDDCRNSLLKIKEWTSGVITSMAPTDPVGVAIAGCGNIARTYAEQITGYSHVRLVGFFDIDRSRAEGLAGEFGGIVHASLDDLLADPAVEIVVNLTIHHVHEQIIRQCLEAGKHVHTEKPLALSSAAAWNLVSLADERGLRLSSAPSTWLGEAQETARRKIAENAIGKTRVATAEVNWGRIELWHPNPAPFYDVGVFFDVAVYPVTLLTAWFGPARRVIAGGGILYPDRFTMENQPFKVTAEDWASAVVVFASGLHARITASFYVGGPLSQGGLTLHGDDGSLHLDRWDVFDSPVVLCNKVTDNQPRRLIPDEFPAPGIEYARGLSDLARAIREDRPHKTTGAHAAHVVEVIEAIIRSVREGQSIEISDPIKSVEPPAGWIKG